MDVAATARREAAKAQAARTEAEAAAEQTRAYAENAVGELKQRVSTHAASDRCHFSAAIEGFQHTGVKHLDGACTFTETRS